VQDRRDADAFCGDDFITRIETLGRDPDPRLGTPDGTWRTFVAALQAGDLTAALAVMTDTAREQQRGRFEKQSAQVLRETGNGFVRFELKAPLGPYRVGVATRNDGQTVTVFFEQSWNGDWRIATI
jgi:hypothetical protein